MKTRPRYTTTTRRDAPSIDVETAPLPLAVAVWDYETITDLDATAVPLGYV